MASSKNIKCYTRDNLDEFYLIAKRGDILEFPRGLYSHFGLYVGVYNGIKHCVIHLTVSDDADKYFLFKTSASLKNLDESSKQELLQVGFLIEKMTGETPGELRYDSLEDVMEIGGKFFINNTKDEKWKPVKDPAEVAIRKYENRFKEPAYDLRRHNCEHFVNDTRYDHHESKQVEKVKTAVAYGGCGALVGGLVGALVVVLFNFIAVPLGLAPAGTICAAIGTDIGGLLAARYSWFKS